MNKTKLTLRTIFLLFTVLSYTGYSQITVNSIQELLPYLDDDNADVKLAPGTYWITAEDAGNGLYETEIKIGYTTSKSLLLFSGNNSTYDFTGVTINVETYVFRAWGSGYEIFEAHTVGNDNVIKNLTLVDVGNPEDNPSKGAISVVMDGQRNRVEGFNVTVVGSYPYRYGDAFGKGGGAVISHRKHSACMVRGNSNHVKNCTFFQKAYGHCIFMQAAQDPVIEGCYVEGELRTTDDMLAEEGTGSPADNVDFMTVWGYRLPAGYTMSLAEDGIRTYNAGNTYFDGTEVERGTNNPTVIDCTVKNMRGGVKITASGGTKLIRGCTVINCEVGYASGSGDIIDCRGDANIGPLLSFVYENGYNLNADITVLPSVKASDGFNNGSGTLAYVGGGNHNITFRGTDSDTNPDQGLRIKVSGDLNTIRHLFGNLDYQNTHNTDDSEINNFTGYPIILADASTDNTVRTCGPATDNGSNNTVTYETNCETVNDNICTKTVALTKAKCYDDSLGVRVVDNSVVGYIENGDWMLYRGFNLTNMNSVAARYSSQTIGGVVEFRLDATDGPLIGEMILDGTGSWNTWETVSMNIARVEGVHDLYLVCTGEDGYLFDLDEFGFSEAVFCASSIERIEAECFDGMLGIQNENCSEGGKNVGYIESGDWTMYSGIDLTNMKSIRARIACNFEGGILEIRQGSETGPTLCTIPVTNTGGNQEWVTLSKDIEEFNGVTDVYLVFIGGESYLYNINYFGFSEESSVITSLSDKYLSSLKVYPNPTNTELFISGAEGALIELFSHTGELILTDKVMDNDYQMDLSSYSTGIFFLRTTSGNSSHTSKIIKK